MDEAEVERIATLMHQAFVTHFAAMHPGATSQRGFTELNDRHQEEYRAVARAVLADLLCEPVVVETKPKGDVSRGSFQFTVL